MVSGEAGKERKLHRAVSRWDAARWYWCLQCSKQLLSVINQAFQNNHRRIWSLAIRVINNIWGDANDSYLDLIITYCDCNTAPQKWVQLRCQLIALKTERQNHACRMELANPHTLYRTTAVMVLVLLSNPFFLFVLCYLKCLLRTFRDTRGRHFWAFRILKWGGEDRLAYNFITHSLSFCKAYGRDSECRKHTHPERSVLHLLWVPRCARTAPRTSLRRQFSPSTFHPMVELRSSSSAPFRLSQSACLLAPTSWLPQAVRQWPWWEKQSGGAWSLRSQSGAKLLEPKVSVHSTMPFHVTLY